MGWPFYSLKRYLFVMFIGFGVILYCKILFKPDSLNKDTLAVDSYFLCTFIFSEEKEFVYLCMYVCTHKRDMWL